MFPCGPRCLRLFSDIFPEILANLRLILCNPHESVEVSGGKGYTNLQMVEIAISGILVASTSDF